MSVLSQLNLVAAKSQKRLSPIVHRRHRLGSKIEEQIKLAQGKLTGNAYMPTHYKTFINKQTGERKTLQTTKRVREWWWTNDAGKLLLSVRYGSKQLDLAKGKNCVELADMNALVDCLVLLKQAVNAGELDDSITAASGQLRAGFKK